MADRIVPIKSQYDEFQATIERVKRDMPKHIEYMKIMGKLYREQYLALIEAGFNEKQALELCLKL